MEKEMQTKTELDTVMDTFLAHCRTKYENDSYAAGYFSSWIHQLGSADPKFGARVVRQLTLSMEMDRNA